MAKPYAAYAGSSWCCASILGLFTEALVAIDGSKFKAVNNRDRNFTSAKLKRRMEEIESSIKRYLAAIETADRQESSIADVRMISNRFA